jgi:hypothetical protein
MPGKAGDWRMVASGMTTNTTLRVRVVGRDVQLECACGFTLRQERRGPIAARCPRCRKSWA